MASKRVLRFGVGSADGVHSLVWRLWATGDEAYVAPRALADVAKVSLHSSGKWRSGFDDRYIATSGMYMSPDANRAILRWHKPNEVAPGWTKAVVILSATQDLRADAEFHSYDKVVWIEHPSSELDTHFTVWVASAGASFNTLHELLDDFRTVGSLTLKSGASIHVVAEQTRLNDFELDELDSARAIFAVNGSQDEQDAYPFATSTALDDQQQFAVLLGVATKPAGR